MKLFLYLSVPLLILDQATKWWIVDTFNEPPKQGEPYRVEPGKRTEPIEVIPGFFNIVRVHNTGMAFGIGNGTALAKIIFPIIATVAIGLITWLWRKGAFPTLISKLAVALLLPGILGNLIDRLLPGRGYVVDFLDFQPPLWGKISSIFSEHPSSHFPSFNVADSCICVAAFFLIISALKGEPEEVDSGKEPPPAEAK